MIKNKINNRHIIIIQIAFILVVFIGIFFFYPKVGYNINGNIVQFSSINSNVIIISKNPDFSNPKYVNFEKDNVYVQLESGKYYWKPANNLVKGFKKEFEVKSEVGIKISRNESEYNTNSSAEIKNIGNVKINVTKRDDGVMIGHIILEPEETKEIEDKGVYEAGEK